MSPPTGVAMASSPPASDDTNSVGTPSTNITAFTPSAAPPETAGRASSGNERRGPRHLTLLDTTRYVSWLQSRPLPSHLLTGSRTGDDVFLSAPTPTAASRLSPTAEVFTPGQTASKLPVEPAEFVPERITPVKNPAKPVSLLTRGINLARQSAIDASSRTFSLPDECINAAGEAHWRKLVLPYADLVDAEVPDIVTPVRVSAQSSNPILNYVLF